METMTFAWCMFGGYIAVTTVLALMGARRTKSIASFAIGDRDMGPAMVGITLAASMASTATFIINPGFVYTWGLSAMIAFTVPLFVGMFAGLILLSKRFREIGDKNSALTLPHWMETRFGSRKLGIYFSLITLLNVFYMVLIVVGSAYVMQAILGLEYATSVYIVVAFVFAYTMLGGTYAHAYTNSIQGVMMMVVAVVLFGSGIALLGDGIEPVLANLTAQDPHLLSIVHPDSPYFSTYFEVIFCALVLGFGLVTQPHLMTKSLYLRSTKDVSKFVVIGGGAFVLFSLIFFVGFYARVMFPGIENQDTIVAVYMAKMFHPFVAITISVAVLAAAMSTLDGLLVAVASIVAHDLVRHAVPAHIAERFGEEKMSSLSLWASRIVIVLLGVLVLILAVDPPKLVGIFGGVGLYGILGASMVPVTAGVLLRKVPTSIIWASAVLGPVVHFGLYFGGASPNPAWTATLGILASALPPLGFVAAHKFTALTARSERGRAVTPV